MAAQQREPDRLARPVAEQLVDGDEIAEGLRHLLARRSGEEAVMHPDIDEGPPAMGADALGDLVLVVREDEIEPAAMDVEGLAEMRLAHRRAFDVPARPAPPPGTVPAGNVWCRRLPQHEVSGIALVGRDLDAGAGAHVVEAAAGELAVIRHAGDREEHVPFRLIGVPGGDQALDHRDHLRDVLGGARLDRRRQALPARPCRRDRPSRSAR